MAGDIWIPEDSAWNNFSFYLPNDDIEHGIIEWLLVMYLWCVFLMVCNASTSWPQFYMRSLQSPLPCQSIIIASDAMFWKVASCRRLAGVWRVSGGCLAGVWRNVLKSHVGCNVSKSGIRCNISKFSARRNFLISKWCILRASGGHLAMGQASGAPFQNLPPDAIFCDYASDLYHEWHCVPVPIPIINSVLNRPDFP